MWRAKRYPQLDGIRAVAIVTVIAHHFVGLLGLPPQLTQGQSGVDAFFLLSGFLLALNLRPESSRKFLLRRVRTIGPAYWVVVAAFVLVMGLSGIPLDDVAAADPLRAVFMHLAFLNALSAGDAFSLVDAWWFMSAIMVLYVSFVPARRLVAQGRWGAMLLCGAALQAAALVVVELSSPLPPGHAAFYGQFIVRGGEFWLGAAVGTFARWRRAGRSAVEPAWLVALAGAAFGAATAWAEGRYGGFVPVAPVVLAFGLVAVGLAVGAAACSRRAPRPYAVAVGWLSAVSFELYLVHQPLITTFNQYGFSQWLPSDLSSRTRLAIGGAFGLVLAGLASQALRRLSGSQVSIPSIARRVRLSAAVAFAASLVAITAAVAQTPRRPPAAAAAGGPYVSPLPPVVSALDPHEGSAGVSVGVTGDHFDSAQQVLFGDRPADFVVDGYQHLTAVAPAGAGGTVEVRVVNKNGTSELIAADRFRYVPAAR